MSLTLSLSLDSHDLNGYPTTTKTAVATGFEWPTPVPEREWTERKFGQVQTPNPRRNNFELEIPLQIRGTEDEIEEEFGKIQVKCNKAEAFAHRGGVDLTAQASDATYATTLQVIAGEITQHSLDFNELQGVAVCTLKLYCLPWLLGPWRDVATGRKPAGAHAWEVQMASLTGHVPGQARITLTNEGSTGQQGVWLGLDSSLDSASNKLVLEPSTFDYSTAPLNGSYTAATSEVQTATKSGTISGGTFTLTWEGVTTSALAYNASTATVQAAVDAAFGSSLWTVSGSALSSGNLVFTATGKLVGSDLSLIVLNSSLTGGGSAPITQTTQGVSGYVSNTSLQSSWSAFMRTGDQTDEGPFDLWALVVTSADANMCRLRATISVGDTASGITNNSTLVPASAAAIWVNLGPVNARKRQSVGTYRWNATISAKTLGTAGTYCRILKLKKRPSRGGVGLVKTPQSSLQSLVLSDDFNQSSGSYTGKTADVGGTVSGDGDSDDFTIDTSNHRLQRTAVSDSSGAGRSVAPSNTLTDCSASIKLASISTVGSSVGLAKCGLLMRLQGSGDCFGVFVQPSYLGAPPYGFLGVLVVATRSSGSWTVLQTSGNLGSLTGGVTITAEVRSSGDWTASVDAPYNATLSGGLSSLATGGALASGDARAYDEWPSAVAATRGYDNFRVYSLPAKDNAIHPSRKLVWHPDGQIEREASGGTYYALAAGQQRAGVPLLDPATSDSYVNRLLIASTDLNPDYGASGGIPPALTYKVEHRPAFAMRRHTV